MTDTSDGESLGHALEKALAERGWSPEYVAGELKVSRKTVWRWRKNINTPKPVHVKPLRELLPELPASLFVKADQVPITTVELALEPLLAELRELAGEVRELVVELRAGRPPGD